MSNAIAFDTLKFAKRLEAAGFTGQQAEALADEQAALIDDRLATKRDLEEMRLASKRDLEEMRQATG